MRLTEAIQKFLKDREFTLGAATRAAYESDLNRMAAFASQNTVLQFTPDLVRVYLHAVSAQGRRMSTLHRKQSAISEFGQWGVKHRLWPENPVASLERIKRPKHLPRPFSETEVEALFALQLPPAERALRALMFFTGLRVTPICALKVGDVSFTPPTLRAWVKGAKVQVIQMPPPLAEFLMGYNSSWGTRSRTRTSRGRAR